MSHALVRRISLIGAFTSIAVLAAIGLIAKPVERDPSPGLLYAQTPKK